MFNPIKTSVFDLFKIGPGPSSSHTIGPMKAGYDFLQRLKALPQDVLSRGTEIRVTLYGSLSATGLGHGTDRAIASGLLGWTPESVDPDAFSNLFSDENQAIQVSIKNHTLQFKRSHINFGPVTHDYPFSNTLVFELHSNGESLFEMEYYSVGGGFIQWRDWEDPEIVSPPYPYRNMEDLKSLMKQNNLPLIQLLLENEKAISGLPETDIKDKLDRIIHTMFDAVSRGIQTEGVLPGTIHLERKAPRVYHRAKHQKKTNDRFLVYLNAYSLAGSEENAAGNIVVTAPTSGASGVIPGILYLLNRHYHKSIPVLREGLMAAAAVGFLVKQNASISGAEIGCMGEVGTASAMAAALISYVNDCDIRCVEVAAEITLEHHLGMTCDPVDGYVQIPCIERNAVGAVKAYNSYLLASSDISASQKISLDRVIGVMQETGRDMSGKYKETSQAGLALSVTEC